MFVSSPKNHILKPHPPVAVFGDGASKEVIKGHEMGALIQQDQCVLVKRGTRELTFSVYTKKTSSEHKERKSKRTFTSNEIGQNLDLGILSLWYYEINISVV